STLPILKEEIKDLDTNLPPDIYKKEILNIIKKSKNRKQNP
ncbi:ParB family protein, partial [Shigella sonnei]